MAESASSEAMANLELKMEAKEIRSLRSHVNNRNADGQCDIDFRRQIVRRRKIMQTDRNCG